MGKAQQRPETALEARPDQHEAARRLDRLDRLAQRMDSAFRLPGTQIRIGFDSLIGLVPGIGDTLTLLPAGYIITEGHRLGAPRLLLARMGLNAGIDWAVGAIPLLGDIFDVGFKANRRNVALLRRHLDADPTASTGEGRLSSHHATLEGTATTEKGRPDRDGP